ncbi:hypothetical protein ACWFQ8_17240 [Streptomyces sp. NPDC055254]
MPPPTTSPDDRARHGRARRKRLSRSAAEAPPQYELRPDPVAVPAARDVDRVLEPLPMRYGP